MTSLRAAAATGRGARGLFAGSAGRLVKRVHVESLADSTGARPMHHRQACLCASSNGETLVACSKTSEGVRMPEPTAPYRLHVPIDRGQGPDRTSCCTASTAPATTGTPSSRRWASTTAASRSTSSGYGNSPKPLDIEYTVDDHADAIDYTLTDIGIDEPFTLVGYSMGGPMAARFAAKYPERVQAARAHQRAVLPRPRADGRRGVREGRLPDRRLAEGPGHGAQRRLREVRRVQEALVRRHAGHPELHQRPGSQYRLVDPPEEHGQRHPAHEHGREPLDGALPHHVHGRRATTRSSCARRSRPSPRSSRRTWRSDSSRTSRPTTCCCRTSRRSWPPRS